MSGRAASKHQAELRRGTANAVESFASAPSAIRSVPFHVSIASQLADADGLVVLAKGIGLTHVIHQLCKVQLTDQAANTTTNQAKNQEPQQQVTDSAPATSHSQATPQAQAAASASTSHSPPLSDGRLILLLNVEEDQVRQLNSLALREEIQRQPNRKTSGDAKQTEALDPDAASSSKETMPLLEPHRIRHMTNTYTSSDRSHIYAQGGIVSLTNRIAIVDLLNQTLVPQLIDGIIINAAHQVSETSTEAFILRLYRTSNRHGFIKALSDEPQLLSKGLFSLDKRLKLLHVKHCWLWPRFQIDVNKQLSGTKVNSQAIIAPMKHPQTEQSESKTSESSANSEAHIKDESVDLMTPDVIELYPSLTPLQQSAQQSLVECMDLCLTQLKAENKSLLSSPASLAQCTIETGLSRQFDQIIKRELNPVWHRVSSRTKQLLSDLASLRRCLSYLLHYDCVTFYRFLSHVRLECSQANSLWLLTDSADRLLTLAKQRVYRFYPSQNWQIARKEAALAAASTSNLSSASATARRNIKRQKLEAASMSVVAPPQAGVSKDDSVIHFVLEENPKWQLCVDTIEEIEADIKQRRAAAAAAAASTSTSKANCQQPFGRVLICCRDERSCWQLTSYLESGGRKLLKGEWRKYLLSQRLHRRPFVENANAAAAKSANTSANSAAASSSHSSASASVSNASAPQFASDTTSRRPDASSNAASNSTISNNLTGANSDASSALPSEAGLFRAALDKLYMREIARTRRRKQRREAQQFFNRSNKPSEATNQLKQTSIEVYKEQPAKGKGSAKGKKAVDPKPTKSSGTSANSKSASTKSKGMTSETRLSMLKSQSGTVYSRKRTKGMQSSAYDDLEIIDLQHELAEKEIEALAEEGAQEDEANGKGAGITSQSDPQFGSESAGNADSHSGGATQSVCDLEFQVCTQLETREVEHSDEILGSHMQDETVYKRQDAKSTNGSHESSPCFESEVPDLDDAFFASDTIHALDDHQLLIHPGTQIQEILSQYQPDYIILYEPELVQLRAIEVYSYMYAGLVPCVRVYFCMFANSAEEATYLHAIDCEKSAFEQLISTKSRLILTLGDDEVQHPMSIDEAEWKKRYANAQEAAKDQQDGSDIRNPTYASLSSLGRTDQGHSITSNALTRAAGGGQAHRSDARAPGRVLVDVREFRSSLPSLLHSIGLQLIPVTLEVGDYILAPHICVERKSVPDLIGSFQSGRLMRQMTQMSRYYKSPVLLIEFDAHRPFHLLSRSDLAGEISSKSLTSKLILLCLHFPNIRLMWARSSHITASMFSALKESQFEPRLEQALVSAADTQLHTIDSLDASDDASLAAPDQERGDRHTLTCSYDMLRKLPGVTPVNIRHLTASCSSLRELAKLSLEQLTKIVGDVQAKKLHSFLHDSVSTLFAPI